MDDKSLFDKGLKWLENKIARYSESPPIKENKIIRYSESPAVENVKDFGLIEDFSFNIGIIAALIGVLLIMCGNREKGTKLTSLSMLFYLIVRVVVSIYVV